MMAVDPLLWENPSYYKYQEGATSQHEQYKIGVYAYEADGSIHGYTGDAPLDMFNTNENARVKWASGIYMPSCIPAFMAEKPYYDGLKNDGRISDLYWNLDNAWSIHNQENTDPFASSGSGGDILNVLSPSCSQYNLPARTAAIVAHWRLSTDPIPISKTTTKPTLKGGPYCQTFAVKVKPFNTNNPQYELRTALPDNPNMPVTANVITYLVTSMITPSEAILNKINPNTIKVDPKSGIPADASGVPIYPGETILPKNGGIISTDLKTIYTWERA